jgi:BirA family biotin operon repressor/biotin-[acetyl-CoA-carboxylase] ligase
MRLPMPPDELGGLSLCVGLAVADALQSVGVDGAALKWPNDVLVDGRKIAGILVEIHRAGAQTEVIMGIGINFRLAEAARQAIDQPVIDLDELGGGFSRNELAGRLISSLVDFSDGFAVSGFAPMRQAFDRLHWFHDRSCTLLIGEQRIVGRVRGVTDSGELALEIDGQVKTYNAGEVSLRAG